MQPSNENDDIIVEIRNKLKLAVRDERIKFVQRQLKSKILELPFNETFEFYSLEAEGVYDINDDLNEISSSSEVEPSSTVNSPLIKKSKKKRGVNKFLDLEAEHSGSEEGEEESFGEDVSNFIELRESDIEEEEGEEVFLGKDDMKKTALSIKEMRKNLLKKRIEKKERVQQLVESSSVEDSSEDAFINLNVRNEDVSSLDSESDSVY
ncbi:hypothetical protein CDIK_0653 [Cucumispora dikerogammari]|nr:hypothetical protein CDIK_0653 [Cucumispora dikerogammari]